MTKGSHEPTPGRYLGKRREFYKYVSQFQLKIINISGLHREKDVEQNIDRLRENDGTIAGKDTPTEIDHALEEDTGNYFLINNERH